MTRLSAPECLTEAQQRVHDAIASGPRGDVPAPLGLWLHRPELAKHAQALGRYCRYDTLLEPRLSELAILVTARCWRSEYEWAVHKPCALQAGLDEAVVEAIRIGEPPPFEHDDEAAVFEFAQALHTEGHVGDSLYREAVTQLGEEAVVDLTGLLGYYTLISMTINVFEVPTPEGVATELG
jgi:4-carboxymuconolactone decarboxylase